MRAFLNVTSIITLAILIVIFFTELSPVLVRISVIYLLLVALLNAILLRTTVFGKTFYTYRLKFQIAGKRMGIAHYELFLIGLLMACIGVTFALLFGEETAWVLAALGVNFMSTFNVKVLKESESN